MFLERSTVLLAVLALALPAISQAQPASKPSKAKPPASQPPAAKAGAQNASTGDSSKEADAPHWGPLGFHATWVRPDWRPQVRDPGTRKAQRR